MTILKLQVLDVANFGEDVIVVTAQLGQESQTSCNQLPTNVFEFSNECKTDLIISVRSASHNSPFEDKPTFLYVRYINITDSKNNFTGWINLYSADDPQAIIPNALTSGLCMDKPRLEVCLTKESEESKNFEKNDTSYNAKILKSELSNAQNELEKLREQMEDMQSESISRSRQIARLTEENKKARTEIETLVNRGKGPQPEAMSPGGLWMRVDGRVSTPVKSPNTAETAENKVKTAENTVKIVSSKGAMLSQRVQQLLDAEQNILAKDNEMLVLRQEIQSLKTINNETSKSLANDKMANLFSQEQLEEKEAAIQHLKEEVEKLRESHMINPPCSTEASGELTQENNLEDGQDEEKFCFIDEIEALSERNEILKLDLQNEISKYQKLFEEYELKRISFCSILNEPADATFDSLLNSVTNILIEKEHLRIETKNQLEQAEAQSKDIEDFLTKLGCSSTNEAINTFQESQKTILMLQQSLSNINNEKNIIFNENMANNEKCNDRDIYIKDLENQLNNFEDKNIRLTELENKLTEIKICNQFLSDAMLDKTKQLLKSTQNETIATSASKELTQKLRDVETNRDELLAVINTLETANNENPLVNAEIELWKMVELQNRTSSDLNATKKELSDLQSELTEVRESHLKLQLETVEMIRRHWQTEETDEIMDMKEFKKKYYQVVSFLNSLHSTKSNDILQAVITQCRQLLQYCWSKTENAYASPCSKLRRGVHSLPSCFYQKNKSSTSSLISKNTNQRALLITCNYPNSDASLQGPSNDGYNFLSLLVYNRKWPRKNIKLISDHQADDDISRLSTYENILESFDWLFNDSKSGDSLVLYFSGFGYRDDSDSFILPTDHDQINSDGYFKFISHSSIHKRLCSLPIGVNVTLVFDCCHSFKLSNEASEDFVKPAPPILLDDMRSVIRGKYINIEKEDLIPKTSSDREKIQCSVHCFGACFEKEISMEGPLEGTTQGLFTFCYIKGLAASGFSGNMQQIHQSINNFATEISNGFTDCVLQHPVFSTTNILNCEKILF
eukprot:GHVL01025585.1.p1 GENE.GHVL01025585.1~~GHVL01025585.1.p1  ORF type:complete len:1027 (+),score=246.03 GHVL01025585.1:59-3139(+)